MKKYFIFAAIAAAGLLTSCSSSDDAISEVPGNPIEQGDDQVPIQIGVGRRASADVARGTGTVGGTTDATNLWHGEHVNVFMFQKGSITKFGGVVYDDQGAVVSGEALYNNTEMRAPQADLNAEKPDQILEYVLSDWEGTDKTYVKHKYYPVQGRFDFWGYHVDDAANGAIETNETDGEILVPFKIDGTQDLMAAVAQPVQGTTNWESKSGVESTLPKGGDNFAYSAKSARATLQPELNFEHLLTRLVFQVKAGDKRSMGDVDGDGDVDAADGAYYTGVFVRDIKVYSRETGKMVAAYTYGYDETDPTANVPNKTVTDLVHWTYDTDGTDADAKYTNYKNGITSGDVVPFNLTSSAKWGDTAPAVKYSAAEVATYNAALDGALPINGTTGLTAEQAIAYNATLQDAVAAGDAAPADYNTKVGSDPADETSLTAEEAVAYNATLTGHKAAGDTVTEEQGKEFNANLTGAINEDTVKTPAHKEGNVKPLYDEATYGTIAAPIESAWKTALTAGSISADILRPTATDAVNAIGGALLVSPEQRYRVVVTLGEYRLDLSVPTEYETGETPGANAKYSLQFDTLQPIDIQYGSDAGFEAGTSYNVVLTIYNAKEIVITANLAKWTQAANDVEETLE